MSKTDQINRAVMENAGKVQAARPGAAGSQAFVARAGSLQAEGLRGEIAQLRAERAAGGVVLSLDPKLIRKSRFSNRDPVALTPADPEFVALMYGMRTLGQGVPATVSPIKEDGFEYEILYGHRRHAAALLLDAETPGGFRLKAFVDPNKLDEKYALRLWYAENTNRKDVSVYEYALRYGESLKSSVYGGQRELAEQLGIPDSGLSNILSILKLPEEVFEAFGSRHALKAYHVKEISSAMLRDSEHVLNVARRLSAQGSKQSPGAVCKALVAPRPVSDVASKTKITIERNNRVVVTIADQKRGKCTVKLGASKVRQPGYDEWFKKEHRKAIEAIIDKGPPVDA